MTERHHIWNAPGDRICRILMIGNSFCMNYLDELYAMAAEAGIRCRISCVIAGACTLVQHWTWHENGEKHYFIDTYDKNGYLRENGVGLDDCLMKDQWDFISYQDGEHYYRIAGMESAVEHTEPYIGNLVKYVRGRFPEAVHCYHQVWAYQVGYNRPQKSPFTVLERSVQKQMHDDLRSITMDVCARHSLIRIPSGDAWEIARNDPRVGDSLCIADCEHDGAEEGGQYLNACVWFETLFGISCIGNTFRPQYPLTEEKITALQEAAHRAVLGL